MWHIEQRVFCEALWYVWNSELHIVLLFSPIAIIVSTNIHLFYDVYLMDPIDCQAVVVASASIYW